MLKFFFKNFYHTLDIFLKNVPDIDLDIPIQAYYGNDQPDREFSNKFIKIIPSTFFTKKAICLLALCHTPLYHRRRP